MYIEAYDRGWRGPSRSGKEGEKEEKRGWAWREEYDRLNGLSTEKSGYQKEFPVDAALSSFCGSNTCSRTEVVHCEYDERSTCALCGSIFAIIISKTRRIVARFSAMQS